jgi:hypothetical protein
MITNAAANISRGGILLHRRGKELQGDLAMKRCVLGQEHLPHSALPDLFKNAVMVEGFADRGESPAGNSRTVIGST